MKRVKALVLTLTLSAAFFTGCGQNQAEETTLYIKNSGKVVQTVVEDFDTSAYSEEELNTYIDSEIDSYNSKSGEKAIKLNKLKIKDQTAVMTITYASAEDYSQFNGCTLFVGTPEEAEEAGFTFDGDFAAIGKDGISLCGADDFLGGKYKVVITDESQLVHTAGRICYASAASVELADDKTVKVGAEYALVSSPEKEEGTEEAIETVTATEVESASDGSIGSDDLLGDSGEDSGDSGMTFDFEEEEETTGGSSTNYVFIIFK